VPAILPSNRSTAQGLLLMTNNPKPTLCLTHAPLELARFADTPTIGAKKMPRGDINLIQDLS